MSNFERKNNITPMVSIPRYEYEGYVQKKEQRDMILRYAASSKYSSIDKREIFAICGERPAYWAVVEEAQGEQE